MGDVSTVVTDRRKSLVVIVGDLSADKHAAKLIEKLRESYPNIEIWGVGGPKMKETGIETLANCEDFAVIGIIEPLKLFPFFKTLLERLVEQVGKRKPDMVLLMDWGGFNLRLASYLKKDYPELPILYFISPQVWGSRPWRINLVKRTVSKMLVIFPFEEPLYTEKGVPARFVGHPLVRNIPQKGELKTKEQFCKDHHLDPKRPIVAIFSGSRKREISDLTPVTAQAARLLLDERKDLQFAFSSANDKLDQPIKETLAKHKLADQIGHSVAIISGDESYNLMAAADIVWAKSGTTTLEVTLFGKPMLIFYRAYWISYLIFCAYKRVKSVGWPNLLAGYDLVPELIQLDCRPDVFVRYTRDLLDVPALREQMSEKLLQLRDQLGHGDYILNVAEEVLAVLGMSEAHGKL